jgi:hypothetical protein
MLARRFWPPTQVAQKSRISGLKCGFFHGKMAWHGSKLHFSEIHQGPQLV